MFRMLSYPPEIESRMLELTAEMKYLLAEAAPLKVDDPYEWLVIAQTEELSKKIEDTKKFTTKFIEKMKASDPDSARILELMTGDSLKERKKDLLKLIKKYPALASADKDLLYQRIAFFKAHNSNLNQIPLPEAPIKDTLDKLEQEKSEPKDEDFLE